MNNPVTFEKELSTDQGKFYAYISSYEHSEDLHKVSVNLQNENNQQVYRYDTLVKEARDMYITVIEDAFTEWHRRHNGDAGQELDKWDGKLNRRN